MIRTLTATRYAVPLREGGSLPAVIEAFDETASDSVPELFVTKFKGAGQGAKALIAEIIVALIGRLAGLPVPEPVLLNLSDSFGRTERDPEIQDILKNSVGLNFGLGYLDGAFNFNPLSCSEFVTPELAADIVWLDAFTTNIDRTVRNPNLMVHNRKLWLIDHGAAMYFHHDWSSVDEAKIQSPFAMIKGHVLLPFAGDIREADTRITARIDDDAIRIIIATIPDELLMHAPMGTQSPFETPEENRAAYENYLLGRLNGERAFVTEASAAQERLNADPHQSLPYRR